MSRLANIAALGYVPLPEEVTTLLSTYIGGGSPRAARFADVCAGEGVAATQMADAWGIPRQQVYLNEIHPGRYQKAKELGTRISNADTLSDLQAPRSCLQLLYMNPPFMWEGREAGGVMEAGAGAPWAKEADRMENLFWERGLRDQSWLQAKGIAILVAPAATFQRKRTRNLVCRYLTRVKVYALPQELRRFNELVLFGVRLSKDRTGSAEIQAQIKLAEMLGLPRPLTFEEQLAKEADDQTYIDAGLPIPERAALMTKPIPPLTMQEKPTYAIPEAMAIQAMFWRSANDSNPEQAQQDIVASGGGWASRRYAERAVITERQQLPSLMPLNQRQALLRVADGGINGSEVVIDQQPVLIKGSTILTEKRTVIDKSDDKREVLEKHSINLPAPLIVTQGADGVLHRYEGDVGIATLASNEANIEQLVAKVRETVPERYDMKVDETLGRILAGIVPISGRKLPGQKNAGLLPMQQHVVAAYIRAVTTRDESWGKVPKSAILNGEMGTGKSGMGLAAAVCMHKLGMGRGGRAMRVILSAPGHMVGEAAQVIAAAKGKASLPPWWEEWADFAPDWHMAILESPHDVTQFFTYAERNPEVPCVGFISNTNLSLDSGHASGCEDRTESKLARKLLMYQQKREDLAGEPWPDARMHDITDELRKQGRKLRRVTRDSGGGAAVGVESGKLVVSKRSANFAERERIRRTIPVVRYGLCCPDCGRRWLTRTLEPASDLVLGGTSRKGDTEYAPGPRRRRCEWCGGSLGTSVREVNNRHDKQLAIFRAEKHRRLMTLADARRLRETVREYHLPVDHRALERDDVPLFPWGEKPTSNPKMALAKFISRRYRKAVDLYVADEVHEAKAKESAIGACFGMVASVSSYTLAMTGTLYGGKSRDVFDMLLRMGNRPILLKYGWDGASRFVHETGVIDHVTRISTPTETVGHLSGTTTVSKRDEELPGVTAALAGIVQNCSIQVLLKHMGFKLPQYTEHLVHLQMPQEIGYEYKQLDQEARKIIRAGGKDALSRYLQSTLCYPYMPWSPIAVYSKYAEGWVQAEEMDADLILPHHEWLAEYCAEQVAAGERVLIYCEHTNRMDIMPDIVEKVSRLSFEEHGVPLKMAILRSDTVKPGMRASWFKDREADGTNVVLCHAKLVKTGLNLIGWRHIVALEQNYSLFVIAQAKKRAFRPTQEGDCHVSFLCYGKSMSERAVSIIARKSAAAAILSGDDLDAGLMEFDTSMSLFQQLANSIRKEETISLDDVRDLFVQASEGVAREYLGGAEDLGLHAGEIEAIRQFRKQRNPLLEMVGRLKGSGPPQGGKFAPPAPAKGASDQLGLF